MSKIIGVLALSIMPIFCITACSDSGTDTAQHEDNSLGALAVKEYGSQLRAQEEAEKERQAKQQAIAYQNAIITLLAQDSAVSNFYLGDDSRVAAAMRNLDISQCPREFAVAYVDHIHAWEDAGNIQRALQDMKGNDKASETMLLEIIQRLSGAKESAWDDAQEKNKQLQAAAEIASANIKETFREVERIAVAYGATLPKK